MVTVAHYNKERYYESLFNPALANAYFGEEEVVKWGRAAITRATLAIRHRWHRQGVQEKLGHSSISLTLDTYSHILSDVK